MLIYLLNMFLIIVWALVFRIGGRSRVKDVIFVSICFCQMFMITSIRYNIGYDYQQYTVGFYKMNSGDFFDLAYEDWEIGYVLLNKVIGLFTRRFTMMIRITSFLSLIGPAYAIARYSKGPITSVFLYINLWLFYLDMSFIRQAIAMSILCFAYGLLRDKKTWRFLLITVIATLFHFSALYMAAVYLVCSLKINSRTFLLYLFGLFYYFMLGDGALKLVLTRFHSEYLHSDFIRLGLYFYFSVVPLILALLAVLLSYYLRNIPRSVQLAVHFTLISAFWQVAMTKHAISERFTPYTFIFMVIAVPEAIEVFRAEFRSRLTEKYLEESGLSDTVKRKSLRAKARKKTSAVVLCVAFAVLALTFTYHVIGLLAPLQGAYGVLPYDTIYRFEVPSIDGLFNKYYE